MATKIETTVRTAAADLAKAGLSGGRHVTMLIRDAEDEAKLAELSKAIAEGDSSGEPVEAAQVFADLKRHLTAKSHKLS
ncbi:MAG: hypothetical protein HQL44_15045 [Alphaproteobacteria bacterium]|nr:hypothetical protein [Alphaproteobacteria bacterium]